MEAFTGTHQDRAYIRFTPGVEHPDADEPQTIQAIIDAMGKAHRLTRQRLGHTVRSSHAKAHGLLRGELHIFTHLPGYLRQGLFAAPRIYPVIARLAHIPGDLDDDRKVSGPRGMSLKVLGVEGDMLPQHAGQTTQDFVLDTGKIFNAIGAKTFLAQIAPVENIAPHMPQPIKGAVTAASLAVNTVLGHKSASLDFFGHPWKHPLAEPYYSQVPIRYGDYIAKLSVTPDTVALKALLNEKFDPQDYDGMRTATVAFFRDNPAEFVVAAQLCTDLDAMPIENANKEWPEDQSPYQPVARLIFPAQDAWSPARQTFVDESLSFCPAHSLAAHQPLGSIMRARMQAYEVLSRARREQNGVPLIEPRSIDEVPD